MVPAVTKAPARRRLLPTWWSDVPRHRAHLGGHRRVAVMAAAMGAVMLRCARGRRHGEGADRLRTPLCGGADRPCRARRTPGLRKPRTMAPAGPIREAGRAAAGRGRVAIVRSRERCPWARCCGTQGRWWRSSAASSSTGVVAPTARRAVDTAAGTVSGTTSSPTAGGGSSSSAGVVGSSGHGRPGPGCAPPVRAASRRSGVDGGVGVPLDPRIVREVAEDQVQGAPAERHSEHRPRRGR